MKKLIAIALAALIGVAHAQTPPITVPPKWQTAPQEQASALAVPDTSPALKTVITVVQCNTVIGVLGIDENGEVHPGHFTSKADVQAIQQSVAADHNLALNVGCPGNSAKDVTVL